MLKKIEGKGRARYLVQCDCGTQKILVGNVFIHGTTKSCGCLKREISKRSIENTYPAANEARRKAQIDGSNAFHLDQKLNRNNSTGVKGVSRMSNGKYRAYITVARKQIYLGSFDEIEDAIAERKAAEEKYYRPILNKFGDK